MKAESLPTESDLITALSERIFSLFVVNRYAAGIQQPNGLYITKYFPLSPFVIEEMLRNYGSMGCYQQKYHSDQIRWLCMDFDCREKDEPDLHELYDAIIRPVCNTLETLNIHYLTEFSGRRGIHIWIIFDSIFSKSLGYAILTKIIERVNISINPAKWALDKFPATASSKGNLVGKQVKFPLSWHQSGGRSFLFTGEFAFPGDVDGYDFYRNQLDILYSYIENDLQKIEKTLGIDRSLFSNHPLHYRKCHFAASRAITAQEAVDILSETRVFKEIFTRMKRGQALPQDWTVLLGTLGRIGNNEELFLEVISEFPDYNASMTFQKLHFAGASGHECVRQRPAGEVELHLGGYTPKPL